jgi:hypothetical protein
LAIVASFWSVFFSAPLAGSGRTFLGNQLQRRAIKAKALIAVIGEADRSDKTSALDGPCRRRSSSMTRTPMKFISSNME